MKTQQRYLILAAAVVMQLCLGATYSWSVYVSPIRKTTGLSQGVTQLPFTIFYFAFPAMMAITGSWLLPRLGPRKCAVIGGLMFGSGWLLSGLGSFSFIWTILGIGLLAGIGSGMAYLIPVTIGMGWFPENKGLVTGVAVAGFGGGAALISFLGNWLMDTPAFSPFQVLSILGVFFIILIPLAGSQMAYAPDQGSASEAGLQFRNLLRDPWFRILYLAMFVGLAAGFGFNANIRELYTGISISTGVLAVSIFALANAAGRISWGLFSDRWNPIICIPANLVFQGIVLISVILFSDSSPGFLVLAGLAGFNYGGVLVLYAAAVEGKWGESRVASIYSTLFSANIPAALSPVLAGMAYDWMGSFSLPLTVLAGACLVSAILMLPRMRSKSW